MYTSVFLIALMGPGAASAERASATPQWQDSYATARQEGRSQNKPLAVFIGSGPRGWQNVIEESRLSKRAKKVLAEGYVCVYVDRTQSGGDQLAEQFDIPEGSGLVLSTRDGQGQAFFHAGQLSSQELLSRLSRYSGEPEITRTEMVVGAPVTSTSAYQPSSIAPPAQASPYGGFGGFGGGFGGGFSGGGRGGC